MRLALAQIDTVVGDLDGNRGRILSRLEEARAGGADLVLFPELAVTGYPPEDLLLRPGFLKAAAGTLDEIASATTGIAALVGTPHLDRDLFNACAVCVDGEVKAIYRKQFLPNYGVFDEDRYFQPGRGLVLLRCGDTLVGPTSGSQGRRRPISRSRARTSSRTSRPRPSTSARAPSARRCWRRGPATTRAGSCS